MEKLIAAGITTVESLADMTAEELGEIPGIGEKTVDKIAVAVRHYFGQYEEGETKPVAPTPILETSSMAPTPEEIIAAEAGNGETLEEVDAVSSEDIAAFEEALSSSDANDEADRREEGIELDNDTIDSLVADSQEVSDETIEQDGNDRA
jgi:N utilization substance protein A